MRETAIRSLSSLLEVMCGKTLRSNLIIVTSKWNPWMTRIKGLLREENFPLQFCEDMLREGYRVDRYDDTRASAWRIVESLKGHMDLRIQQVEYVIETKVKDLKWMEWIEKCGSSHGEEIAQPENAKEGLHLDLGSLKEGMKSHYQDEVDRLGLEKSQQKQRIEVSQKHQARVKASSIDQIAIQGIPTAAVDLGNAVFQSASKCPRNC